MASELRPNTKLFTDSIKPWLSQSVMEYLDAHREDITCHIMKSLSKFETKVGEVYGENVKFVLVIHGLDRILERLDAVELIAQGRCPECKRFVSGYKPPSGTFAPEAWASLREEGIDPGTGHLFSCSRKSL